MKCDWQGCPGECRDPVCELDAIGSGPEKKRSALSRAIGTLLIIVGIKIVDVGIWLVLRGRR